MRILHLYSDHRWTGPAEPVVRLCAQLNKLGLDVRFACRLSPRLPLKAYRRIVGDVRPGECSNAAHAAQFMHVSDRSIAVKALHAGVEQLVGFRLNRYFNALDNLYDLRALRRYIDREHIDIVHTHLSHDHLIGGLAARMAARGPRVVRTNHKGIALKPHMGNRFLLESLTDGYISFTRIGLERDKGNFALADHRVLQIDPAVDLGRFREGIPCAQSRKSLGIPDGAVVVGIVARMQRHRRFGILLEGFRRAVESEPSLRLLVVGRGTHRRKVAIEPAQQLGIRDKVIFAGYRSADFVETVAAMDFKIFLVPGSDGTCRAVREAMAMGKPVIVASRGMLPELVIDGRTGLVIEDTPEHIANAVLRLARDSGLRTQLGSKAAEEARSRFDSAAQAARVAAFYATLA
ncbi:MAG: glycosyltransferase [Planctomycetota bacterium]|nr:glycosyltransferase [Planctomycetota bacterium]